MTAMDRWFITKMIYGSQVDEFDFHYVGFDASTLPSLLVGHNFCEMKRVDNFNIIGDTSTKVHRGRAISLNIVANKCGGAPTLVDPSSPYTPPTE